MKSTKLIVLFFLSLTFLLTAQKDKQNFYAFYKHKAKLSDFYLKQLPIDGICYEKICGFDLVTTANPKEYFATTTYVLLVTEIINKNLDADFYLMSTFENSTGKLIENKFFLKSLKSIKDSKTKLYQTTNLIINKKDPSFFTLETVEEKSIFSIIKPSPNPILGFKKIKNERFKINLTGFFSRALESKTTYDNTIQSMDIQKISFLRNEILANYDYDTGDAAMNKLFASKIKTYKPLFRDVTDIKLSEPDKEIISFIDKKLEEIGKLNEEQQEMIKNLPKSTIVEDKKLEVPVVAPKSKSKKKFIKK